MLNLPTRCCCLLLLLALTLFAAPSALGAPGLRHDTSRAARHRRTHHHGRHSGGSATVRQARVGKASAALATATLLGDEAVESQHDYLNAGQAEAFRFQALASGDPGTMHVYIDSRNRASTIVVGIYANANGHPGTLLGAGAASSPKAGAWDAVPLISSPLVSGTTYWIAILGEGGTLRFRDRGNGPCPSESSAQTNLGTLPASWSTGPLYTDCPVSAYVSAGTGIPIELPTEPTETTPPVEPPPPPPPAAPTNTTLPAIAGTTTEGQTLSASTGAWTGSPTSYKYKWEDCNTSGASCASVTGATSHTYTLGSRDVGDTLRVVVTATNEGGSTPATSAATAKIADPPPPVEPPPPPPPAAPTNTTLPAITGTTTQGQALDASTGAWTGSPTSYKYQWEDCNTSGASCASVTGATTASYTLGSGDVGHTIRVVVTATNEGGSTPATSPATATIEAEATGGGTGGGGGGGTGGGQTPPPSPACTQTVSSVSSASSAVSSAAAGSAICLTAGSYGHLTLSGNHSGNVTVESVPGATASLEGATVASSSSYITIHNFDIGGGVNLGYGDSHITVDHNNINGQAPGGTGEGVEDLTVNCSAPNAPTYSGCTSTAPDTYLTINGNQIHGYGMGGTEDAIHLNNWEHVTITANDIYNLEEHGNHTDAMQSVFGGHYMTFERNFEHDNQSQGFFIKDGDASEVTVNDNLFLRNNNEPELYPGGEYNIQVFDTTGLSITNNTVWDGQDDIIRAEGAAEALTASVNHNVEQDFDVLHEGGPAYTLTEDYDIFKEEPWTFKMGSHSKVQSSPDFADPASEDYELASNPNDIGVNWQPSEYVYGPTGD